ncbi:threonine dehydratase [Candidatus Megaera polyxenophila]|nr:threonine dehydratase [Candidatus Megaera polyxenophila]
MSKTQLSPLAKGLVGDIKNCVVTNTTKAQVIGEASLTSYEMIAGRYNSSMSTIEGLGARALMSFAPPEEIQTLVNKIHAAEETHRTFIGNSIDAGKGRLSAAKTEAALKGYALPVSKGGPYDEITLSRPFTDEEREMAFAAAKEALLTVANKNIPSAEYGQKVQEEYAKIIRRNPDLTPERIAVLEEYAIKGTIKKQGQALPELEKEQIKEAAQETLAEFNKIFSSHKDKMLSAEPNIILEKNAQKFLIQAVENNLKSQGYSIDPTTKKELEEFTKRKIESLNPRDVNSDAVKGLAENFAAELSKSPRFIVLGAIKDLEKENGYIISENQAQRLVNKLSPALAELDPEYLKQYSEIISGQIQKEVVAKSMVTASVLGGIYIREGNLDKIANNLSDAHLDRSDKMQIDKIETNLSAHALKDSQLAEKLTELEVEKAKSVRYDVNKLSDKDLAQMRKENPVQFDKTVLGRDNPVKEPKEAIIDKIISEAIDNLKKENGVSLKPEREKYLKDKFTQELSPALSKLDPEYLKKESQAISRDLQKELYDNKSTGYRFGMAFSVSTESLSSISGGITAKNQQRSNEFEVSTIRSALTTLQPSNTQFEGRLTDLAVEKAKATKFKASAITGENLLAMRKENPARFDKVVLGVGKERTPIDLAKTIGATVREKEKEALSHPPTPRQPPPLLSQRKSSSVSM